jgi:hypothetical protein
MQPAEQAQQPPSVVAAQDEVKRLGIGTRGRREVGDRPWATCKKIGNAQFRCHHN